jgi:L-ribulose-5-phosphate 3-epimerase
MNVGISCLITPAEWSFDELLQNTKSAGYESLELVIRDQGEITLDTPASELEKLTARAKDAGMILASVCPSYSKVPRNFVTADDAVRAASIDTCKRALDVVKGLGIDTMLLTLGAPTADLYYHEAYTNAVQSMQRLAPHAEDLGVNVAIEFVWQRLLVSPMEFAQFCEQVASPRIGFYFDSGNMMLFGYPEHWVRICGKHLMKVHFKDFKRQGYQWTPLMEGDVNFAAVMAELRKIGYDDALLSEVGTGTAPFEDTAAAIRKIMEM